MFAFVLAALHACRQDTIIYTGRREGGRKGREDKRARECCVLLASRTLQAGSCV